MIDEVLYLKEAGGANGILVRYMEEELKTRFAGQSELARKVLVAMAAPEMERWVLPESLLIPDVTPASDLTVKITAILDQFVKAELLVRRLKDERYQYAFVNQMIYEEAVRLGGEQITQQYNARDEVERVWRLWLASQTKLETQSDTDHMLATRQQLRTLAETEQFIDSKFVKLLLLLRSAVLHGESTQPWLNLLQERENLEGLVQTVEDTSTGPKYNKLISGSSIEYMHRILGFYKLPEDTNKSHYGQITRAAVFGKKGLDRQTAILTLSLIDQKDRKIIQRIDTALQDIPSQWSRFWRRSELIGTLADANQLRSPSEYKGIGIYLWRVGQRLIHQRQKLIWSAIGGGLGAGFGLGIDCLLIGSLAQSHTGVIFFALFSYWGLILGGLTALASKLSSILRLENGWEYNNQNQLSPSPHIGLSLFLGTVGFGLANLLIAMLNGISLQQAPGVIPLGFVAGLGISLVFFFNFKKTIRILLFSLLAAFWFSLVQYVFLAFPMMGSGISIALSSAYFQVEFEYFNTPVWQNWINSFQNWSSVLSLIESALAALALTFGGASCLYLAEKYYRRWLNFIVSQEK